MELDKLERKVVSEYKGFVNNIINKGADEVCDDLIEDISKDFPDHFSEDLSKSYDFTLEKFKGEVRKDGRTPAVSHTLFLGKMLSYFDEKDERSYLTTIFHDLVEDTNTSYGELEELKFNTPKFNAAITTALLTENKKLSKKPGEGGISTRTEHFINQLLGSPSYVITAEVVDRLHDMSDLDYLDDWEQGEKRKTIRRKMKKCKNIVYHMTLHKTGFNNLAKKTFDSRMNSLEKIYDNVPIVGI